jgi:hypothetical protein
MPSQLHQLKQIECSRRVLAEQFTGLVSPRRSSVSPADRHGDDCLMLPADM